MKRLNELSISAKLKAASTNQPMTARRPAPARGNPVARVQGALAVKLEDRWEEF
jgi:hypothetical protein